MDEKKNKLPQAGTTSSGESRRSSLSSDAVERRPSDSGGANFSPNACDSMRLGNQGRIAASVTGTGEVGDAPGGTTPRNRGFFHLVEHRRSNSLSGLPKKRKVLDTSLNDSTLDALNLVESPEAFTLVETIGELTKQMTQLEKIIQNNNNTKREIKEIAEKMKRQVDIFGRKMIKEWLQKHKYEIPKIPTYDVDIQTNIKPETCSQSTQTSWIADGEIVDPTTYNEYEDLKRCKVKKWPEKVFCNTEIIVGNPLDAKDMYTKIVIVEPDDKDMQKSIQKLYKDRFPELLETQEEFEVIQYSTKVSIKGQTEIKEKKIIKITYTGTGEDIWNKLKKVKQETKNEDTIILHHINTLELEEFRKIVESIFHKTQTMAVIYTTSQKTAPKYNEITKKTVERNTYGLLIDTNNDYKKTLENIKKSLENSEEIKKIQTIRKTKDGKMLITIDKDKNAVNSIKQKIVNSDTGKMVELGTQENKETLFIRGIDGITKKEEVLEAIKSIIGAENDDLRVSDLRENDRGTQTAVVTLKKEHAGKLLEENIRIGMVTCQMEKSIRMKRCFKCWQFDHVAKECKGLDRTALCRKCAKEGHLEKECKETEYCVLCDTGGHVTGRGKCREYKRALSKMKKNLSKIGTNKIDESGDDEAVAIENI